MVSYISNSNYEVMKKVYLLMLLLFVGTFLSAQTDSLNNKDAKGRKQGKWIKLYEGEKIVLYKGQFKDDIPTGKFTFYYKDGSVKAINQYQNRGKDSYAATYFPNGKVMSYGKYINKKKDSTWTYYDNQGNLSSTEEYSDGALNGKVTVYYPFKPGVDPGKPRILEQTIYKDGLKHGPWARYTKTGKKLAEGAYLLGDFEGKQTFYYTSGQKKHVWNYKNGAKHGFFRSFNTDGEVVSKVYYWKGVQLEGEVLEKHLKNLRAKRAEEIEDNKRETEKN